MPVFAHPQNLDGVEVAVDSGVDVLAHTVPQSPPWTPEFVSRLKSANLTLIPTLTLFDFEARKEKGRDQQREAWIAKMVRNCAGTPRRVRTFCSAPISAIQIILIPFWSSLLCRRRE